VIGARIFAGWSCEKFDAIFARDVHGRKIAPTYVGREKLIASGIWLQHESRLSSELELFANSKLSWDSSVRREDRVTGISRPTATNCSNMWL